MKRVLSTVLTFMCVILLSGPAWAQSILPQPEQSFKGTIGLRFNQFHTTALCSPTRAALLTGRNHHSVATGGIMEIGVGYPGYNTFVPRYHQGNG